MVEINLTHHGYNLVRAGRDQLADDLRQIDCGNRISPSLLEVGRMRVRLRSLNAAIDEHRARLMH